MADIDETNGEAERSRMEDVLAAVPTPNRATRRKLEALGEAVPVPEDLAPAAAMSDDASAAPDGRPEPFASGPDEAALAAPQNGAAAEPTDSPEPRPAAPEIAAASSAPATHRTAGSRKLPAAAAKPVVARTPAGKRVPAKSLRDQPAAPASIDAMPQVITDTAGAQPASTTPSPFSSSVFSIKDMTMDMSTNFSGLQTAMSDAQAKAQAAFEKSSNVMGEVGEFTKGNVEALIQSSKIFAEGCQEIGSNLVAESRTAFETMTGDIKELAAAKSPTDFLKIQSDMLRKNFDTAVAYGSKNSETFLKLMSDAAAPLSGRVSLAVEKVRQTTTTATAATV